MVKPQPGVSLKVVEALQDDVYKGIARIDPQIMRALGLNRGDIISIKGNRETVAIVDRAYPADIGEKLIRIDGLLRRNARTGVGEMVVVNKAKVKPASKIIIAPAQQGITVQADPEMFKPGLLGRPVMKGDIVSLGGVQRRRDLMSEGFPDLFGGDLNDLFGGLMGGGFPGFQQLRFVVVNTSPSQACFINEATEIVLNSKVVDVSDEAVPDVTYEDVGGLHEEVKKVREMIELPLKHPEIFDKLGIEPPKGVILHGPPGTGKTLLAKAVANETDSNFVLLNGPEIMSKFYGESEKKIRDIFDDAEKNSPSIIFIDEIDAIAPKREEVQGEVERRVVSQILTMMDGLKTRGRVVVIGATNRINSIDPALRRPGRFDREIAIGVPDKDARLNILKIHTRNMPLSGPMNPSLVSKEITRKVASRLNSLNIEEKDVSSELSKLKSSRDADKGMVSSLSDTLKGIPLRIKKLENVKNILSMRNKIREISSLIVDLEHNMDLWGSEDPRNYFMEFLKSKKLNEQEEIISDLIEEDILDKSFYEEIRKRSIPEMLLNLAAKTHGFVGADLNALTKEAAMNVLRKFLPELKLDEGESIPQEILDKVIISQEDFDSALRVVRPSAMREVLVETPNIGWDDIGGLDKTKQDLKEAVEWPIKHPDSFKKLGIRPPRGILLYGPPGTGKTLLAKAVAKESESNFIQVKGPSLLSMWVGKSEEGVRKVFERARQVAPCIIFFDEIDSLAGKRGVDQGQKVTERVLNQLLSEMDGLEELKDVTVVAATNRPDMLDSALLRPGRFDRIILVDVPDAKSREMIFNVHLKNTPLEKGLKIDDLVKKTEGFVGADIEALVREASMNALRRDIQSTFVKKADFEEALKKMTPSVSTETAKRYKKIEDHYLKKAKVGGLETGPIYAG